MVRETGGFGGGLMLNRNNERILLALLGVPPLQGGAHFPRKLVVAKRRSRPAGLRGASIDYSGTMGGLPMG